jgi:hypothetical protein
MMLLMMRGMGHDGAGRDRRDPADRGIPPTKHVGDGR